MVLVHATLYGFMSKLTLTLDDEQERRFRKASKRVGMKKRSLRTAVEGAIGFWIEGKKRGHEFAGG